MTNDETAQNTLDHATTAAAPTDLNALLSWTKPHSPYSSLTAEHASAPWKGGGDEGDHGLWIMHLLFAGEPMAPKQTSGKVEWCLLSGGNASSERKHQQSTKRTHPPNTRVHWTPRAAAELRVRPPWTTAHPCCGVQTGPAAPGASRTRSLSSLPARGLPRLVKRIFPLTGWALGKQPTHHPVRT